MQTNSLELARHETASGRGNTHIVYNRPTFPALVGPCCVAVWQCGQCTGSPVPQGCWEVRVEMQAPRVCALQEAIPDFPSRLEAPRHRLLHA